VQRFFKKGEGCLGREKGRSFGIKSRTAEIRGTKTAKEGQTGCSIAFTS